MRHLREYIRNIIAENYVPASSSMLNSVYIYKEVTADHVLIGFFNKSLIDDFLGKSTLQPGKHGRDIADAIMANNGSGGGGKRVLTFKTLKYFHTKWEFEDPIAAKMYGNKNYKGDGWKLFAAIDGMIKLEPVEGNDNVMKVAYTATHGGTKFGPILKDYALSLIGDKIMIPDRGKKEIGRGKNKREIPSVSDDALRYYRYIINNQLYDKYDIVLMDDNKLRLTSSGKDDVNLHYPKNTLLQRSGGKRYPVLYNPSMGDISNTDIYDIGLRIKKKVLFSDNHDVLRLAFRKWDGIYHDFGGFDPITFNEAMKEILEGFFGVVYGKKKFKGPNINKVK